MFYLYCVLNAVNLKVIQWLAQNSVKCLRSTKRNIHANSHKWIIKLKVIFVKHGGLSNISWQNVSHKWRLDSKSLIVETSVASGYLKPNGWVLPIVSLTFRLFGGGALNEARSQKRPKMFRSNTFNVHKYLISGNRHHHQRSLKRRMMSSKGRSCDLSWLSSPILDVHLVAVWVDGRRRECVKISSSPFSSAVSPLREVDSLSQIWSLPGISYGSKVDGLQLKVPRHWCQFGLSSCNV